MTDESTATPQLTPPSKPPSASPPKPGPQKDATPKGPPPKRAKSASPSKPRSKKRASAATSAKVKARKAPKKKGAGRNPKEWIMSVHMPMPLLARLDKRIAAMRKTGTKVDGRPAGRSNLAVTAIAKLVK